MEKVPMAPSQPDQSALVENLILLETLRKQNLATELKLAEAKLEHMKLSANSSLVAPPPVSPVKLQTMIAPCSNPAAPVQQFTTMHQVHHDGSASRQKESKHFSSQQLPAFC